MLDAYQEGSQTRNFKSCAPLLFSGISRVFGLPIRTKFWLPYFAQFDTFNDNFRGIYFWTCRISFQGYVLLLRHIHRRVRFFPQAFCYKCRNSADALVVHICLTPPCADCCQPWRLAGASQGVSRGGRKWTTNQRAGSASGEVRNTAWLNVNYHRLAVSAGLHAKGCIRMDQMRNLCIMHIAQNALDGQGNAALLSVI